MSHHHATTHHPHQVLMDPSQMGAHHAAAAAARHLGHHPGQAHYGAPIASPHAVVTPLYPGLATSVGTTAGVKRSRPDDLDLSVSGMPDLEQSDLDSMGAYGQPTGTPQQATPQSLPPTHHHHRLPDTGPPSKMMRRDGEGGGGGAGGAPSVVGQAGMPPPAPRPRGPKLKFTPEDDQLLIDLKENKSLTWKQIADFFPGRSSGTLQVRYCTKLKAKTTQWTDETDQKLRTALQDYENEKWRIVANKEPILSPGTPRSTLASISSSSSSKYNNNINNTFTITSSSSIISINNSTINNTRISCLTSNNIHNNLLDYPAACSPSSYSPGTEAIN
ncbi:hypothetical protein Sste5344_001504 [Sporothrix stenoceras]